MHRVLVPLLLTLVPTAAQAEWYKATSEHFEVYAEGEREDIYDYAENLERFDSAVRRLRSLPQDKVPGSNRVRVYQTPKALFDEITARNVGGFYRPGASTSSIFIPEFEGSSWDNVTTYHEYSHHLLMVAWANFAIPGWLNEGLAQLQSTPETKSDGSVLFGREIPGIEWGLRGVEDTDLKEMITHSTAPTGNSIYYSGGWIVSHFLSFDPDRQGQLVRYLVGVNKGLSTEQAAEQAFGDLQKFTSDVRRYRRGTSLPAVRIPAKELHIGKIEIRPLTAGEEATIELAIRSRAGVNDETASGVYEKIKAASAPYPDDAWVQRVFAEAAFDADHFEEALAAAESASKIDPTMAAAYAYRAMAMRELGKDTKERLAVIEEGLRASPADAQLLEMYYTTFIESGDGSNPLAKSRLIQAYRIAPQDPGLRTILGSRLLNDGQAAEARAILRPLAFSPHRSATSKRALKVVEAIESGDIDSARAALSAPIEKDDENKEKEDSA